MNSFSLSCSKMFGVSDTSEAGGRGRKKKGEGERRERSECVEREKEGEAAKGCQGQERSWDMLSVHIERWLE